MVIFPSGESRTPLTSPPWASLILVTLSILGFLLIKVPLQKDYQSRSTLQRQELFHAMERQYRQGHLSETFWINAQEDPQVVGLPENREIFSPEVRKAYREYRSLALPMELLARGEPLERLALAITPHDLRVLIAGAMALLLLGFLFEHLFDRQVFLGIFLISAALWMALGNWLPEENWPSPVFCWSNTVAVLVLVMWLSAPGEKVTLTLRLWFVRGADYQVQLPLVILPVLFILVMVVVNYHYSPYRTLFQPMASWSILAQVMVFLSLLLVVPNRNQSAGSPMEQIDRELGRIQAQYGETNTKDAEIAIRRLLDLKPDPERLRGIAELAWKKDMNQVARQAYFLLLKEIQKSGDPVRTYNILSEMIYRGLEPSEDLLYQTFDLLLERNLIPEAGRMLKHMENDERLQRNEVISVHERFAKKLLLNPATRKIALFEVASWLERHASHSPTLEQLRTYFDKLRAVSDAGPIAAKKPNIHRFIDVKLQSINKNQIEVLIQNELRKIPWTAVEGIYGCRLNQPDRGGPLGCILLKFQRKIFACTFRENDIMIRDRIGALPFEKVWEELRKETPEDLPFQPLDRFEEWLEVGQYESAVKKFVGN